MAGAGLVTLFLMLFSGFIIPRSSIQPYWVWVTFLNPFFYAFQVRTVSCIWAYQAT